MLNVILLIIEEVAGKMLYVKLFFNFGLGIKNVICSHEAYILNVVFLNWQKCNINVIPATSSFKLYYL